jgi:predicted ATPase/DNA-binding XRE family transcriptional regulator
MIPTDQAHQSFAALLQHYRLAAGLSQEELAERAGLSVRGISDLERGARRNPYPSTVRRLAAALRLNESVLTRVWQARTGEQPGHGASAPVQRVRHNLPAEVSSFVGREQDVIEVSGLLERSRLLTLTGVGGIGKTRLALRVGTIVVDEFESGAWLHDLVGLSDPRLLAASVVRCLGFQESRRPSLDTLIDALKNLRLLLILDNCEHLIDACAELVQQLLAAAPSLRILATSRQPLDVAGEVVWRVPPLAIPEAGQPPDPDALVQCESVRLFVDRARAANASFRLDATNTRAVAEVCTRLEGLPLALQLAAAWVGTLAVQQIVDRLDNCFVLLTRGNRGAPSRQQTLRATLDWSHDLLSADERRLFRRLAVFAGRWTLDAAERVCGGDGLAPEQVLDVLRQLVAKSLVVVEPEVSAHRYRLLEPVLQYARGRLVESAASSDTADIAPETLYVRHAEFYQLLVERAEQELTGPGQIAWLDRLESEQSNLRAAMRWLRSHGDPESRGLQLASAMWRFWWLRSAFAEGQEQLLALLDQAQHAPARIRARGLHALGELALRHGDADVARPALEAARELYQSVDDALGVALTLRGLGRLALDQGNHAEARSLLEVDLQIERELANRSGLPWVLTYLSWLAIFDGDHALAGRLLDEGIALCRELGDLEGMGRHFFSLGHLALDASDLRAAAARFTDSLALFTELDYKYGIVYALEGLSDVAAARGQAEVALRAAGAAARLREVTGAAPAVEFRERHAQWLALAREILDETEADAAWAAGVALAPGAIVAELLTNQPVSGQRVRRAVMPGV